MCSEVKPKAGLLNQIMSLIDNSHTGQDGTGLDWTVPIQQEKLNLPICTLFGYKLQGKGKNTYRGGKKYREKNSLFSSLRFSSITLYPNKPNVGLHYINVPTKHISIGSL